MNLEIREARLEESEWIARHQVMMAFESERMRLDPEKVSAGVKAVFQDPAKGQYFVALHDSKIVGCMLIQYEWSDWRNRTVLWIHSLYVVPEYRTQGVFRALYDFQKKRVETNPNLGGLRLYVDKTNETAIKAYEKISMTREHYHLYEWMKI